VGSSPTADTQTRARLMGSHADDNDLSDEDGREARDEFRPGLTHCCLSTLLRLRGRRHPDEMPLTMMLRIAMTCVWWATRLDRQALGGGLNSISTGFAATSDVSFARRKRMEGLIATAQGVDRGSRTDRRGLNRATTPCGKTHAEKSNRTPPDVRKPLTSPADVTTQSSYFRLCSQYAIDVSMRGWSQDQDGAYGRGTRTPGRRNRHRPPCQRRNNGGTAAELFRFGNGRGRPPTAVLTTRRPHAGTTLGVRRRGGIAACRQSTGRDASCTGTATRAPDLPSRQQ